MKTLMMFSAILLLSAAVSAETRLNSKESVKLCQQSIVSDAGATVEYKFNRKVATSAKRDSFIHRINATEISEDGKELLKITCKTSRSGEILSVEMKPGNWSM